MSTLDLFTRENIAQGLMAAAEEMFYAWGRTSQSSIIYEVLDCACGISDAEGNLISQANGVTMFMGAVTFAAQAILRKFGKENLKPGDMFLSNDPYTGSGTHLNDIAAIMPVFYGGELVAFVVNKGHWNEIGGKQLGSWATDATEIFQEGLQLPDIRIYDGGVFNESVRDIIEANTRTPEMAMGELFSQTAALRTAEARLIEIFDKYGKSMVLESMQHILDNGYKLALLEIGKLVKGSYEAEDILDTGACGIGDIKIKAKVTITDEEVIFDFTGTDSAVMAPINCSKYGAYSGARIAYNALIAPHASPNEGFYRPLKVIAPEGSLFNAPRPFAVSCNWEAEQMLTDIILKAMAPALPERIAAGHFLSISGTIIGGTDDRDHKPFVLCEPHAGGWGAGYNKDGENGLVAISDGETFIIPAEVCEYRYPLRVEQYAIRNETGAGYYVGGRGLIRDYRITNSNAALTTLYSRHKSLPWGLQDGQDGAPNSVEVIRAKDNSVTRSSVWSNVPLDKGDVVRFTSGSGGGYGNPRRRPAALVLQDWANDFITDQEAREVYGVVIDTARGLVDEAATNRLRG